MPMHRWFDLAGRLVRGDSCLAFLHASALKVDKVMRAAGLRGRSCKSSHVAMSPDTTSDGVR